MKVKQRCNQEVRRLFPRNLMQVLLGVEGLTGREASTAASSLHPTNQLCWFHASHQSAHSAGTSYSFVPLRLSSCDKREVTNRFLACILRADNEGRRLRCGLPMSPGANFFQFHRTLLLFWHQMILGIEMLSTVIQPFIKRLCRQS